MGEGNVEEILSKEEYITEVIGKNLTEIEIVMGTSLERFYTDDRYNHIMRVTEKFIANVDCIGLDDRDVIDLFVKASLLHDVGYSQVSERWLDKEENEMYTRLIGYRLINRMLKSQVIADIVMIHSYMNNFLEISKVMNKPYFDSLDILSEITYRYDGDELFYKAVKLLNACDLTTDNKGNDITLTERMKTIEEQYGKEDIRCMHMFSIMRNKS